jgi:hypothetical protein
MANRRCSAGSLVATSFHPELTDDDRFPAILWSWHNNYSTLEWHDIPLLVKHRGHLTCLNNSLLLTHGNPIGFSALSSGLMVDYESFSAICPGTKETALLAAQCSIPVATALPI